MKAKDLFSAAALFSAAFLWSSPALAVSGKDKVVAEGDVAELLAGWPDGVLEMINFPLRTEGWHPWFSECPNDLYYYEYEVARPGQVNDLIKTLAAIKAEKLRLRLDVHDGDGPAAVFALGNQPILDRWFRELPAVAPGVRAFGGHRYRKPPTAQPPTLTIYVGHDAVDLSRLKVPDGIELTTPNAARHRAKQKDAFRKIDEFIEKHKAETNKDKPGNARKRTSGPT